MGETTYVVRKMERDDVHRGFLETLENLTEVGLDPEHAVEVYDRISEDPNYTVFVAEDVPTGEVIGTTTLFVEQKFIHGGARAGHIEDVATRAGYEGNGIGKDIVKRAIDEARKQGCYRVELACSDELLPFYEDVGFERHENDMRIRF